MIDYMTTNVFINEYLKQAHMHMISPCIMSGVASQYWTCSVPDTEEVPGDKQEVVVADEHRRNEPVETSSYERIAAVRAVSTVPLTLRKKTGPCEFVRAFPHFL